MNRTNIFENTVSNNQLIKKIRPTYFNELKHLPNTSLIFIAIDRFSLHLIRRHSKPCLFCNEPPERYDLDFCFQREVWILYANQNHFIEATQLAYTVQRFGAKKVLAILVDNQWVKEVVDV